MDEKCFRIKESNTKKKWTLCAGSQQEKNIWYCTICSNIGKPDKSCEGGNNPNPPIKTVEIIVKQPEIIIPIPSPFCNEKWDYKKQGSDWQCECNEGKRQSPINLPKTYEAVRFFNKTLFDFYTVSKEKNISAIFEDYMIKLKGNFGRLITWDLIQYDAYEMQFHTSSEHTINRKHYDLEVQIHFRASTPGYISNLAILSVLYKVTPGAKNQFFDKDINILDLPDQTEKTKILTNDINLKDLFIEDESDLFQPFSYYQYEGSLTAPPCQG